MTSTIATGHDVRDHCLAPTRTVDAAPAARYGRMFPDLPALSVEVERLVRAGAIGGICDGAYGSGDDGLEAAGWPLFGQFVAHDITADRSPLSARSGVAELRNARSPRINLEAVHADGPVGMPFLYDVDDPAKFLLSADGCDLPRNTQAIALVGDPRNDVHLFVSQLHLAFLRAHNGVVDRLRADGVTDAEVFDVARRALAWHYQWIVVNDYLPRVVGRELVASLLADGPRYFRPGMGQGFIPLEFADAAYRFGHAQIRDRYRINATGRELRLFPDAMGFGRVSPENAVGWEQIFDLPGHQPAQRAKRMDGRLPSTLISMPARITGAVAAPEHSSLAVRDLLRGQSTGLPAGEVVAQHIGVAPLRSEEAGRVWQGGTPLWLYVLKEAEHRANGDRLGPVGGRIVGDVLVGLLLADPESYLVVEPTWRPTLPRSGPDYSLVDLLSFATSVADKNRRP